MKKDFFHSKTAFNSDTSACPPSTPRRLIELEYCGKLLIKSCNLKARQYHELKDENFSIVLLAIY